MKHLFRPAVLSLLALLVCFSTIAVPQAAFAQTDLNAAKEKFREGREAYQNEEYAQAAELFVEAYGFSGRSELLYNIGQAYKSADNLAQAEKYFQQYLSEMPDAKNADEVVNMVIEIQQEIAARLATLQMETAKPGRQVYVDEEPDSRCETPCALNLNPGTYKLTLKGKAAKDKTVNVTLGKAEKKTINETLEAMIVKGRFILMTDRGGRLQIGTDIDQVFDESGATVDVQSGPQTVKVTTGRAEVTTEIDVKGEESVTMIVPLNDLHNAEASSSWMKLTAYGLGGAALALGIGGAIAGSQAQSTFDEAERQQAANGGVDAGLLEAGRGEQSVANVLYFSAIGALAVGATLWVVDEFVLNSEPTADATPAPSESAQEPAAPAEETSPPAEEEEEVELL